MTKWLDKDEKGANTVRTLGENQRMTVISEPGLYNCIMRSNKDEAKRFRRWVTHEVLPSIRKTWSYSVTPKLTREQQLAQAVLLSQEVIAEKDEKIAEMH